MKSKSRLISLLMHKALRLDSGGLRMFTGDLSVLSRTTVEYTVRFINADDNIFTPERAEHSTTFEINTGSNFLTITPVANGVFPFSLS